VLRAKTASQRELGLVLPVFLALIAVAPLKTIARHAPDLLTSTIDIYRFVPDSGEVIGGVGARARAELIPAIWQNFDEARAVLLHWIIVTALFRSMEGISARPGPLSLSNLWSKLLAIRGSG
jgi:hypothetical protein